jgi:ketosteroid isomerase-like protein
MKKLSFYPLLLLAVYIMQSCNQPAKPAHSEEEMIAAAKAVDAKFIDGMNNKNLNAIMSCYWNSAELEMFPPGEVVELKGYDAAKASFAKFIGNPMKAKHELTETHYKVAGDNVIGWGHVTVTIEADSGAAPMVLQGRYTEVLAYKDSNMVYIIDHASIPMQEPGPPPTEAPAGKK